MTARVERSGTLRSLFGNQAAGGIALMLAAALAMLAANLPATANGYAAFLHHATGPVLSPAIGAMTVHRWIDDAAMALFFLVVGLEIKRELIDGDLSRGDQRRLPFVAAAAGMIVPALVYLAVTGGDPRVRAGWAIPAATDIAFAIGVLALLGRRVPPALKLLLTTVAIVDDMGAIAIIAIGYTRSLAWLPLAGAGIAIAALYALSRRRVMRVWPYLAVGALLWLLVLRSGIHPTIAGVVTAMFVPVGLPGKPSPLHRIEHALQPWTAFAILPLFAFANAGVAFTGAGTTMAEPVVLGVACGLFVGKQIGIFGGIWGAVRLGLAVRPAGVSWMQLYGMALIAGIGFTMSLFIGALAFAGNEMMIEQVKIGVLAGSLLSALVGATVLAVAGRDGAGRA